MASAFGAAAIVLGSGCILISSTEATQCTEDADCADLDATCDLESSVCVPRGGATIASSSSGDTTTSTSTGEPTGCTSNQDCIDKSGGQPEICPEPGGECISIFSPDCSRFFPEDISLVADDNVLIFGHLAGYTGEASDQAQVGGNAVQLAAEELAQVGLGLPIGGVRRPIVFVSCDSAEEYERATDHLVDTLKVPAIIGPEKSSQAYELAVTKTVPSGTLLLLPGDTSAEFEAPFPDQGLVWHTNPSDADQADVFAVFLPILEQKLRDEVLVEGDIRVAAIVRSDVTSQATAERFFDEGTFNGKDVGANQDDGNFRQFVYNPENPDFEGLTVAVRDYAPTIILNFSNSAAETVNDVIDSIESEWLEAEPRPYWLLTESVRSESGASNLLENYLQAQDYALEDRLFGTRLALPTDRETYDKFRLRYEGRYDGANPSFGLGPASYDATYLLAYATLAAGQSPTLNGQAIASGFGKLVGPGAMIALGRPEINSAFSALSAGASIDVEGNVSRYDFDLLAGIAPRRSVIWCTVPGATIDSTFYREEDGTFDGDFSLCDKW